MQEQGLLGSSSDDIAKWLIKGEMLNKRAIGDYLGEGWVWFRAGGVVWCEFWEFHYISKQVGTLDNVHFLLYFSCFDCH